MVPISPSQHFQWSGIMGVQFKTTGRHHDGCPCFNSFDFAARFSDLEMQPCLQYIPPPVVFFGANSLFFNSLFTYALLLGPILYIGSYSNLFLNHFLPSKSTLPSFLPKITMIPALFLLTWLYSRGLNNIILYISWYIFRFPTMATCPLASGRVGKTLAGRNTARMSGHVLYKYN